MSYVNFISIYVLYYSLQRKNKNSFDFPESIHIFLSLNWYSVSFMKIETLLKNAGKKSTPERLALYEKMEWMHLFESKDLVQAFPEIGRASIFRSIKLFCEIWALRRIYLWDNHEKYEVECCSKHHHEHMKCNGCWDILSFDSSKICNKIFSQAKKLWFHISEHSVNILGRCKNCI